MAEQPVSHLREDIDNRRFGELTLPEQLAAIAEFRTVADECTANGLDELAVIARWFADDFEAWLMAGSPIVRGDR